MFSKWFDRLPNFWQTFLSLFGSFMLFVIYIWCGVAIWHAAFHPFSFFLVFIGITYVVAGFSFILTWMSNE